MSARGERQDLLAATIEVYSRGGSEPEEWPCPERFGTASHAGLAGLLSAGDEAMVEEVTVALEAIVRAVRSYSRLPTPPPSAVLAAIGGAELLMRTEILAGRSDWLTKLLPSFVFVATLPYLDREEALRLADRTRTLAEKAECGGSS